MMAETQNTKEASGELRKYTSEFWISLAMFVILNIFLIWLWRSPLTFQSIGVKLVSLFFSVIFFCALLLDILLAHKIVLELVNNKSEIKITRKHFIIFIILIVVLAIIFVNLQVYNSGITNLLCDKVVNKPSSNCNLVDFNAAYTDYKELLNCDNIYEAGKNNLGIFSFLKNKQASCLLGKLFKI